MDISNREISNLSDALFKYLEHIREPSFAEITLDIINNQIVVTITGETDVSECMRFMSETMNFCNHFNSLKVREIKGTNPMIIEIEYLGDDNDG